MISSRIPDFYKRTIDERQEIILKKCGLKDEIKKLRNYGSLGKNADRLIENAIGIYEMPLGIATNFLINGKDYLIPMATEESSVIAAASKGARIARRAGGFKARTSGPYLTGQIQVIGDFEKCKQEILDQKDYLLDKANEKSSHIKAEDLTVRRLQTRKGEMLIAELKVNTGDAMGANAVNSMTEKVGYSIQEITGGEVCLRILSNLADKRITRTEVSIPYQDLGKKGKDVAEKIEIASAFAEADPYRAATHNKGIMNGIDAVVLATGNDFRAVEAGAHAYAARKGKYEPLSRWWLEKEKLRGELEIPVPVGILGGAISLHPKAKLALEILDVDSGAELSDVCGSVGLAQNFAALLALSTEGIQKGHMKLHARNIAAQVVPQELVDDIASKMVEEKEINPERARELLEELNC